MKSLQWLIIISRHGTGNSSLRYLLKCFKYVSKDKFDSNQVQWTARSMIWRKFNLSHHLISWRNRIGPLSSRSWALSDMPAKGWNNEDPISGRRFGLLRHARSDQEQLPHLKKLPHL
jgi:hypothetical protein